MLSTCVLLLCMDVCDTQWPQAGAVVAGSGGPDPSDERRDPGHTMVGRSLRPCHPAGGSAHHRRLSGRHASNAVKGRRHAAAFALSLQPAGETHPALCNSFPNEQHKLLELFV